jgi:hypothetical protein
MTRTAIVYVFCALAMRAQNFQPPSWGVGQGQGAGQGQGTGQGTGQGQQQQQIDQINARMQVLRQQSRQADQATRADNQKQINQLQSQLEHLREQQRRQNSPPVEAQVGPILGRPVSGKETRHTTQTLMDGTVVDRSETSYFHRDAAGRMRAEGPNGVEIFDPVAHVEYELIPAKKTYIRYPFSGNVAYVSLAAFGNETHSHISSDAAPNTFPDQTGMTEDLGLKMINGVMAKGSRVTITIPAGALGNNRDIKVVNERWYSDALGALVKSINTDPRFGVNEYELTEISQSAPDTSLFTPPYDYTLTTRGH